MDTALDPNSVLILAPNWVGDSLFMLPAVAALRRRYPQAKFTLLAKPGIAALHQASPLFDEILPVKRGSYVSSFAAHWALRPRRFGLCVVFPPSFSSALAAYLSGAKLRLGRIGQGRGIWLNWRLPAADRQRHVSEEYMDLARMAGAEPGGGDFRGSLLVTAEGRAEQERLFAQAGLSTESKQVALCPTSAFGPSKIWPTEYFADLARRLKEGGYHPFALCAPDEAPGLQAMLRDSGGMPLLTPGLAGLAAALSRSALAIANDSGPLHIAAALGVPSIGIYGPVDPKWSRPLSGAAKVLYTAEACSPCFAKDCPLKHHDCMRKITPEQVYAVAVEALKS